MDEARRRVVRLTGYFAKLWEAARGSEAEMKVNTLKAKRRLSRLVGGARGPGSRHRQERRTMVGLEPDVASLEAH